MTSRRYAMIGAVGAGKTSLLNALNGRCGEAIKTQAVEFDASGAIDTPGEFFSHPRLFNALIQSVNDVPVLVYVHAANEPSCRMPPGILSVYGDRVVIPVITQCDRADADIPGVIHLLNAHDFSDPILTVSIHDPESISRLAQRLDEACETACA